MVEAAHLTVALAGHTGHGKTALALGLAAAQGCPTPRRDRRSTEELSVVPIGSLGGRAVVLIDVPGHPRFLKNAVRGFQGAAAVVLVVAADDGVRPQTLDHLRILELLQVRSGFTVVTRADLVDAETLELAQLEIEDAIRGTFLEGQPVLTWAATDGRGLNAIRRQLAEPTSLLVSQRSAVPDFRLWIDRVWSVKGFGTVVTGTIGSGSLETGDDLMVEPAHLETKARFLEILGQRTRRAVAGQRVGVNLAGIAFHQIKRGMALVRPETLRASGLLNTELRVLAGAPTAIIDRQRVRVHLGTAVTSALLVVMAGNRLEPGQTGLVQLRLRQRLSARPGDACLIGPLNRRIVIAGGTVLETPRDKYRAVKAVGVIPYLEALRAGDPAAALRRFFARHGDRPVGLEEMTRLSGFPPTLLRPQIEMALAAGELVAIENVGLFSQPRLQTLQTRVLETTEQIHQEHPLKMTITVDEIRDRLRLDKTLLRHILGGLCRDRSLTAGAGGYHVTRRAGGLSAAQEEIVSLLLRYAEQAGLGHFNADMFWKHHQMRFNKNEVERLLEYLRGRNRLIRLKNNRYLTPRSLALIRQRVEAVITRKGRLTLEDSKEILGYGRTGAVPVLEYLDAIGVTRRIGNERVLTAGPPEGAQCTSEVGGAAPPR